MNKKDIPLILLLFGLLFAWPPIYNKYFKPAPVEGVEEAEQTIRVTEGEQGEAVPVERPALEAAPEAALVAAPVEVLPETEALPEETATLENDEVALVVSSRGAGITQVVFKQYPATLEEGSGPVVLDFEKIPALAMGKVPGLGASSSYQLTVLEEGRAVQFERRNSQGIMLSRRIQLDDAYMLSITDELLNESGQPLTLPEYSIQLGAMRNLDGTSKQVGIVYLGVDALLQQGDGVKHYGKKLPKWLKGSENGEVNQSQRQAATWVAAKNKFFAQILMPDGGAEDFSVIATQDRETRTVDHVSAEAVLGSAGVVPSGAGSERTYDLYLGPKKYSELDKRGLHLTKVMELGWFAFFGKYLLVVLNLIHDHLWPYNYGLAIMLLTIIIRVLFWPLTHKGTENMKRMQEIAPLMKEIKEKHKDNPQKQQQAMMELYKKHKVNPMMGCLPMLVQIPVFISLFYVLRSAVELRYADFLWVHDLSEPEGLLTGIISFPASGLNVLPLIMAATTFLQQKLTPTAGDPNQQKIMMFMPIIMLFFLYSFPSGLVLYWTTNNVLMIVQQLLQRRKKRIATAA